MRYDLRGKRVLLTGASSGIGRDLAIELARKGALLALVARREDLLQELGGEIAEEGRAYPAVLPADLSVRGSAAAVAEQASRLLGGIDIVVNNAGGGVGGSQWNVGDRDEAREAFEVNFWSPLALTAAVLPEMLKRDSGVVVNVTSLAKVMTWTAMGHYSATKAALSMATETLSLELTGCGVRVLEVLPGPVDTPIQAESRLAPGFDQLRARSPMGDPAELARLMVRALERGDTRLIYPRSLTATYHFPGLARQFVKRQAHRLAGSIDRNDPRVVRTGSHGDPEALAAREAWFREHQADARTGRRHHPAT